MILAQTEKKGETWWDGQGERERERERERESSENVSRGASVNLTNLIHLARAGDGVIKSTQVTYGGESNYFINKPKKKQWQERGNGTPFFSSPILLFHLLHPEDGSSLLRGHVFIFFVIALDDGSSSLNWVGQRGAVYQGHTHTHTHTHTQLLPFLFPSVYAF